MIYYWVAYAETILMLYAYPKNKQEDLKELKVLKKIIEEEYYG